MDTPPKEITSTTVRVEGRTYPILLERYEDGWVVECPSLPGCMSQGDDFNEALAMIIDAIRGHLKIVRGAK